MRETPTVNVRRPGWATALLLAAFLALTAPARAEPAPQATAESEEARLDAIFAKFDARRDAVEGRLRALELKLIEVQERLNKLRGKLRRAEAELALRTAELEAAIRAVERQRLLTKDSAASIYMRGPFSYANALLNARSVGDLVRVEVYSESVLNDFIRVLHELEGAREAAERAHAAARARVRAARQEVRGAEREEAELLGAQQVEFARRQVLINQLIDDFGGLDELRKRGFDIIIRAFSGTNTRIETLLREAQRGQEVAEEGEYFLRWPVEERRITSGFGWRIHPIWGYRSFHTGLDLGSKYGAEIVSSLAGRVVEVGYMGAYGLTIVIDHGDSLATVYAHLSRAAVAPGDTILSGDRIGYVGCTGWCTGPHVHFEVRLAAKPLNPLHWL